jgi:hypothetical protein
MLSAADNAIENFFWVCGQLGMVAGQMAGALVLLYACIQILGGAYWLLTWRSRAEYNAAVEEQRRISGDLEQKVFEHFAKLNSPPRP